MSTSGVTSQSLATRPAPSNGPTRFGSPDLVKLRKAAGEFEGMLLQSLWKSMKDTFSTQDDEMDSTLESFDEWGMQALASAVGDSGGLGIKNMILSHLEPTLAAAKSAVPGAD